MRSTVENLTFWRSACLRWNKNTGQVEIERSRKRWLLWALNFSLHLAHLIFLFVRYIQFNFIEESSMASVKIYTEYAVVAYTIPLMLHLSLYFRLDDVVSYINEYNRFYSSLEGKFSPQSLHIVRS